MKHQEYHHQNGQDLDGLVRFSLGRAERMPSIGFYESDGGELLLIGQAGERLEMSDKRRRFSEGISQDTAVAEGRER
ncbi:hypothetical protein [Serratia nevei]|uniref:hypothetical protein n=1 Tax=Serratia nevei TaxID=2703794 RepID=UPI00254F2B18|nr:hypothetical protein [Serratia nevei]MDK5165494.1 hypothetical protein [Serratia nevei]